MPIFHQKNQPFKTLDVLVMFGMVGVIATLSGVVLARNLEDERPGRARSSAEALAIQIVTKSETPPSSIESLNSRAPASVESEVGPVEGEMGRDPWGQPFHYLILRGSGHKRVVVWSDGANHASESMESVRQNAKTLPLSGSRSESHEKMQARVFRGDDIGFIREQ